MEYYDTSAVGYGALATVFIGRLLTLVVKAMKGTFRLLVFGGRREIYGVNGCMFEGREKEPEALIS